MLTYLLTWVRTLKGEEGQDLAEYALLIALIALLVTGGIAGVTGALNGVFGRISTALGGA